MKRALLLVIAAVIMTGCVPSSLAQEPMPEYFVYLPIISKPVDPLATPTPTNTPTVTPTFTPTETSTPTSTPTDTPTPTNTPTLTPQPVYELLNGDLENGQDGSWVEYRWGYYLVTTYMELWGIPYLDGYGSWLARLGGLDYDPPPWEFVFSIEQLVTVPSGTQLCFEYLIYSEDWWDNGGDTAGLFFDNTTLASWDIIYSNSDTYLDDWHETCFDVESWWDETAVLRFEMTDDWLWTGAFFIDNVEFRPIVD